MVTVSDHVTDYLNRLSRSLAEIPRRDMADSAISSTGLTTWAPPCSSSVTAAPASTASHMAAYLAKNTIGPNMTPFRVTSTNDNMSLLTALANDAGYENVYREQLVNLIQPCDVLIAMSASGDSANVLNAIQYAKSRNAQTVGLSGSTAARRSASWAA